MEKNKISFKTSFFGILAFALFATLLNNSNPVTFKRTGIQIGSQILMTQIAVTDEQKATGLMYRDSIDDTMMFFKLDNPQRAEFWMKNVKFDLEIAFIDSSGTILEIVKMDKDNGSEKLPIYRSQSDQILYGLEARVGLFNEKSIKVGDKINLTSLNL